MMRGAWVILVALACCAVARAEIPPDEQIQSDLKTIYATTQAEPVLKDRGELCERLEKVLLKQGAYIASTLKPWEKDPSALLIQDPIFSKTGSHIEAGIRPNTHTAYGLAVLARSGLDKDAKERAIAILRFVLPTHGAGGMTCNDGKQWHDQWQSALWAGEAGKAAWLLWNDLDPKMKWLAGRMICDEADRFLNREPDHNVVSDTKAEENAWNSDVIALAYNMFPNHPRHEAYRNAAIWWQITAFATSADTKRTEIVDGKPLNEWVKYPNIYDDFTLENHDRVHPDYMTSDILTIYQMLTYEWAHNAVPQSVTFHAKDVYAPLKTFCLPDAGYVYPNGQDWQLHRNADWLDRHVAMSVLFNDPQAAMLSRIALDTAEKMIGRSEHGAIYAPGETHFPSSQGMLFELYAHAYLLMRAHGEGAAPISEAQLWKELAGKHLFQYGKFGILRTEKSVASFSWGRQIMGMAFPLRQDLLLTPNDRSLIGMVTTAEGKSDRPKMLKVKVEHLPDTLAVSGIIQRAGGAIEQRFAFVALPDGRTIYADIPTLKGAPPKSVELGTVGILNDTNWVYHDGVRTIHSSEGEKRFEAKDAAKQSPVAFASSWFNVDGLGIVVLSSSGQQVFHPQPTRAASRLEQLFHLNHPASSSDLAPTALVFYPDQNWTLTRDIAPKNIFKRDGNHLAIALEDRTSIDVDLDELTIRIKKP